MAKGQMRSNKEKKKPKADKNIKKGGAAPSPFAVRQGGRRAGPDGQEELSGTASTESAHPLRSVTSLRLRASDRAATG